MSEAPAAIRRPRGHGPRTNDGGGDWPEPVVIPLAPSSRTRLRTNEVGRLPEVHDVVPRAPPVWIRRAPLEASGAHPEAVTDTHHHMAAVLGMIAGYVDTTGFLALYGMFTAHITGDLVASVAELSPRGIVTRLAMIPIFMVSVAVATMVARATRRDGRAPLFPPLALMTAALAVFCAMGVLLRPFMEGPSDWAVGLVGGTGVAAMAIQNMIMRDALHSWTPTTIMTGNLTQVTIQLVELVVAARERDPDKCARIRHEATQRLVKFGSPLAGFVSGTALSAVLTRRYGFWSVGVPTVVVAGLAAWHWRQARGAGAQVI